MGTVYFFTVGTIWLIILYLAFRKDFIDPDCPPKVSINRNVKQLVRSTSSLPLKPTPADFGAECSTCGADCGQCANGYKYGNYLIALHKWHEDNNVPFIKDTQSILDRVVSRL